MERSPRELFNDIVIHRGISKDNRNTLFLCFILPQTGVSFNWED